MKEKKLNKIRHIELSFGVLVFFVGLGLIIFSQRWVAGSLIAVAGLMLGVNFKLTTRLVSKSESETCELND